MKNWTVIAMSSILTTSLLAGCSAEPEETVESTAPPVAQVGEEITFSEPSPDEWKEGEEDAPYEENPTFELSDDQTTLTYRSVGSESCPPTIERVNFYEDREYQVEIHIAGQSGSECELEVLPFTQEITLGDGEAFPADVAARTISPSGTGNDV